MHVRRVLVLAFLPLCSCSANAVSDPPAPIASPTPATPALEERSAATPAWTIRELASPRGFLSITLKVPTTPEGAKPAVINPVADEEALLRLGIVVVRYHTDWSVLSGLRRPAKPGGPDGIAPRNVVGTWMLAAPRAEIVGRKYFAFIKSNARRVLPEVIDRILETGEVDSDRIGISGSSTNGFIALEAMAEDSRLAAAVVRAACGEYHEFLRASSLGLNGEERWLVDGQLVLDEDYEAELAAREPIRHATSYPPRFLLLLNGAEDPAIPTACVEPTVDVFRRVYEDRGVAQRFRAVIYPDRGHDLGPCAEEEALGWWRRWFAGGVPRVGSKIRSSTRCVGR